VLDIERDGMISEVSLESEEAEAEETADEEQPHRNTAEQKINLNACLIEIFFIIIILYHFNFTLLDLAE
jgi:hypothetical protein